MITPNHNCQFHNHVNTKYSKSILYIRPPRKDELTYIYEVLSMVKQHN